MRTLIVMVATLSTIGLNEVLAESAVSATESINVCWGEVPCEDGQPCHVGIRVSGDAAQTIIDGLKKANEPDAQTAALGWVGYSTPDGRLSCIENYGPGPTCFLNLDVGTGKLAGVPTCE